MLAASECGPDSHNPLLLTAGSPGPADVAHPSPESPMPRNMPCTAKAGDPRLDRGTPSSPELTFCHTRLPVHW
jgi:hypothetical protein